ncbi:hypothetical protein [Vibrio crassostreae]|uniref:hypothetical protein n=1 Tax=Vibrio crassostreae TaxID=246167 RepID=UPI001B3113C0|nr:hypothetical protein [Vibrio crassostreae]
MKLSILGTKYTDELIEHVKAAVSETLSPVKRDAVVRSLLVRLLGANNEHELESKFIEELPEAPKAANIVMFQEFDSEGKLYSYKQKICTTSDSVNKALSDFFNFNFPDHDGVADKVADWHVVEKWIDNQFECPYNASDELEQRLDKERDEFYEELRDMTNDEICDWLLENIDIFDLTSEDFFCDFLNHGMYKIEVDYVDIDEN